MPNIGAFIAWGFIAAIFIDNGWFPNKDLSQLAECDDYVLNSITHRI